MIYNHNPVETISTLESHNKETLISHILWLYKYIEELKLQIPPEILVSKI